MASILVGVDGSERGRRALDWAVARAERTGASLMLLAVVNSAEAKKLGAEAEMVHTTVEAALHEKKEVLAAEHPDVAVEAKIVDGPTVDSIVEEASSHDMVVLGSHHGASITETFGGATGLRVSVQVKIPTVVVPCDWDVTCAGKSGVVVGVGPDNVSDAAVAFGVGEAIDSAQPLELVSAWGIPAWMSRPAEGMGGGLEEVGRQRQAEVDEFVTRITTANPALEVTGRSIEGPSPTRVLLDASKDAQLLVLGTHSRAALGRALFGSVTHSMLLNLATPTVVVPKA